MTRSLLPTVWSASSQAFLPGVRVPACCAIGHNEREAPGSRADGRPGPRADGCATRRAAMATQLINPAPAAVLATFQETPALDQAIAAAGVRGSASLARHLVRRAHYAAAGHSAQAARQQDRLGRADHRRAGQADRGSRGGGGGGDVRLERRRLRRAGTPGPTTRSRPTPPRQSDGVAPPAFPALEIDVTDLLPTGGTEGTRD